MTATPQKHLNNVVFILVLFFSHGFAIAESSMPFDQIVKKFDAALKLDMELFAVGKDFSDAANCTPKTMADTVFPYEKTFCDIAAAERLATTKESDKIYRSRIDPNMAAFFGLIGLVGLAIIENAKDNPNASYSGDLNPIQGPSAIETHLWLNPGG